VLLRLWAVKVIMIRRDGHLGPGNISELWLESGKLIEELKVEGCGSRVVSNNYLVVIIASCWIDSKRKRTAEWVGKLVGGVMGGNNNQSTLSK
jgi:hypothetical protein